MNDLYPRASILLVSYNQEKFIKEAFESLLNQTYENLEIIVADDFSADRTKSILKGIASNYVGNKKIIFHESDKNLGLCENINRAIRLCNGELIFLAAGDDVSLLNRCKKVMDLWLKLNKKPDLIATDAYDMSYKGKTLGVKKIDSLENYHNLVDLIKNPPYFFGCTFSVSKRLVDQFPPIDPAMLAEDHVLLFRAIISGGAHTLAEPLVLHRRGGVTVKKYIGLSEKIIKLKIGYKDKYRYINQIIADARDSSSKDLLVEHFEVELNECKLAIELFDSNKSAQKVLRCIQYDGLSIFFKVKILAYSTFPWMLEPIFKTKWLLNKATTIITRSRV